MRAISAKLLLVGVGLALPWVAFGQVVPMPVIPALQPPVHVTKQTTRSPVLKHHGTTVSVTAKGRALAPAPTGATGRGYATRTGVRLDTRAGFNAHADVSEVRWNTALPTCAPGSLGCGGIAPVAGVQGGDIGAGYAGHGVKLDLSLGQTRSVADAASVQARGAALPRVLPAADGADVAAPLWFRNSTATHLGAHGEVRLAPNTSLDLGASVGRVRFLPGAGVLSDDTLDQTTVSFGVQHGAVRGAIVGHVLEPNAPGAALGQNQTWSAIDLGVSVRLPWRGELNFGAQNVWTSGRSSLLFGPNAATPDQGRVPYIQYHQDL
ncbi:MAG TPA: hypothetical protein VF264_05185 [Rhodanobacteraceae bacterium]